MHAKTIPNQVTVATGKISHTGVSSYLPEFEFMKTLVPQEQWGNIKLTLASPSWYAIRLHTVFFARLVFESLA